MPELDLTAGTITYEDSGGPGPVVVLLHGLLMDARLWDGVVADLSRENRCVVPTLPLGAHRRPMRADADLSLSGVARLVGEFLDRLDLRDVVLVGNDTGGALVQLMLGGPQPRVARVVLVACEAFDNFPPRLTGTTVALTGKLPAPLFTLFMQQMRLKPMRRLPIAFGWLTKRGDAATKAWLQPMLHDREIRRDLRRQLKSMAAEPHLMADAAAALPEVSQPTLVVWARGDRIMLADHGRRLAELFPQGRLVEIDDSYTLIPLDQPARLAEVITEFVAAPVPS
jgi:pimeloyl-ACP methyl ester carboxylesterase